MGIEMCERCNSLIDTDSEEMFESLDKKYDSVCDSCAQDEYEDAEDGYYEQA